MNKEEKITHGFELINEGYSLLLQNKAFFTPKEYEKHLKFYNKNEKFFIEVAKKRS